MRVNCHSEAETDQKNEGLFHHALMSEGMSQESRHCSLREWQAAGRRCFQAPSCATWLAFLWVHAARMSSLKTPALSFSNASRRSLSFWLITRSIPAIPEVIFFHIWTPADSWDLGLWSNPGPCHEWKILLQQPSPWRSDYLKNDFF